MSFFSTASETAIRLLIYVQAHSSEGKKLGIQEIAKNTDTPVAYAAKIMQILSRKGLVNSSRGMHGGFYIGRYDAAVTLHRVIEALDGMGFLQGCGLGLKDCTPQNPCPMHEEFSAIRQRLEENLKANTIGQLADRYLLHNRQLRIK